jgi:hypothetical protein
MVGADMEQRGTQHLPPLPQATVRGWKRVLCERDGQAMMTRRGQEGGTMHPPFVASHPRPSVAPGLQQ